MRIAGRAPASRLLTAGLITLIGGAAVLPHPTPARAFPFEIVRWVWGDNERGELGNNADQIADRPILSIPFPAGTQLTRIAAGSNAPLSGSHSLAVDRDRHVWAWGFDIRGQVGDGGSPQTAIFGPVRVCAQAAPCSAFLGDITAVAAGGLHSLALDIFSNVFAWGSNEFGQLGSSVGNTSVPIRNNALFAQLHQVPGTPSVTAIAAGAQHSLALDSRGVVWAWGANSSGQLGLGNFNSLVFALPITFPAGEVITAIAGGRSHSLALDNAGNVWAWGDNSTGQLGISSFDANRNTPAKLIHFPPNTRIVAIAAGSSHSLALDSGGTVWTWGANAIGQLGNGQNIQQNGPTRAIFPVGTPRILSISAGASHNLAIDASRNTWAWGANGQGQLGNQQRPAPSNLPVRASFPDGTRIVAIAAGGFHSLALESRSFFDVEVVLDFDVLTAEARLLPQSVTQDSIDLATTSETLDRKGKKRLVTHALTDTAGNTLVLVLTDRRKTPTAIALELESVQYNGGAVLTLPKNRIKTRWKTDASGAVIKLRQRLFVEAVDGVTKINTKYLAADNQTRIKVKTPAGRQRFTAPGLVTVQVGTINGALGFSDGEHIWP